MQLTDFLIAQPSLLLHPMSLYSEIHLAANVAIKTLNQIGVTACFVGGMACKLYGNSRTPGVCVSV